MEPMIQTIEQMQAEIAELRQMYLDLYNEGEYIADELEEEYERRHWLFNDNLKKRIIEEKRRYKSLR